MSVDPRDFGAAEARIESLEKSVDKLSAKVDTLLALANKGRGAWWAGLTVASLLTSCVTFVTAWFTIR